MSDVKRYWIPGPLTNYGTTATGFHGEVLVVAASDYDERERDLRDLTMQFKAYDVLRRAVNESTNECGPDCDDYGHGDGCPACSPSSWLEDQKRRIDALEARLAEKDQYIVEIERDARARLAEAGRDSRRLQWLADNPRGAQIVVDGKTQDCVFWGISAHPRATLREAIDAAMGTADQPTVAPVDPYEYRTTHGQRKCWDGEPDLSKEGWEEYKEWERFDYHEERYWRRLKAADNGAQPDVAPCEPRWTKEQIDAVNRDAEMLLSKMQPGKVADNGTEP